MLGQIPSFLIRPVSLSDLSSLYHLATSLSAHGFLTLPTDRRGLEEIILCSRDSFEGKIKNWDEGKYLFVLEEGGVKEIIGSSLIMARHGTPDSPHFYFQVDPVRRTMKLQEETTGRTELGGLILAPPYRRHPEKLGKRLSYIRLLYIARFGERFCRDLIAELLPPFTTEGKSLLWEVFGRKLTGLDYQEADRLSRRDKKFLLSRFPSHEIPFNSFPLEAQRVIGVVGLETKPVVTILTEVGFRYLHQIDPFDGGPHYGAGQEEIRIDRVKNFLLKETHVALGEEIKHLRT